MKSALRKCKGCGTYSMETTCPKCGEQTVCSVPPRYSPDDRYAEYRRTAVEQEYGENGKCH